MFLLPVICRGTNINSLCYTSSFNVCCSIPCLNDALPAHILNSLARNSWLHSVFLQFAKQRGANAEFEQYFMWCITACSWWILEDCFSSIAPYRFSFGEWRLSCRFLSFSKSSKIFQNSQWNRELPQLLLL